MTYRPAHEFRGYSGVIIGKGNEIIQKSQPRHEKNPKNAVAGPSRISKDVIDLTGDNDKEIHASMLSIAYNSSIFPKNEQEKFVCTHCLKFNHFDLESALKDDNRARVEVENLGSSLEDKGIEFEDEEDHTVIPSPTSSPSATYLEANPIPSNIPTNSTPYPPLNPQPGSSK
ncbi:hypothetical protein F5051DRAFT_433712 [Lentinula edodes]|nr:hypothetical protein F5051DRAFT_433712 [Lentinula edodes]